MNTYEIYFSPTGGTKKTSEILTKTLASASIQVNLTDSRTDYSGIALTQEDIAVIAMPSYGGRVPGIAAQRLAMIYGGGARAVLVCVYGNRAYEDTLIEMRDLAFQAGFRVIGAVAAIAEHSIARQFGAGRPDEQDVLQLTQFAVRIQNKIADEDMTEPSIPGNRPYKKAGKGGRIPMPTEDCIKCGICAEKCPVQAIDPNDPRKVDENLCISCMGCISVCPHSARKLDPAVLAAVGEALKKVCSERKNCEVFL